MTAILIFCDLRWERGDISFIFTGVASTPDGTQPPSSPSLVVADNILQVFQRVRHEVVTGEVWKQDVGITSADVCTVNVRINFD